MTDKKLGRFADCLPVLITTIYVLIVVIAWGINFPILKLAIRDMPPLTFSAVRLFGGAIVISSIIFLSGSPGLLPPRSERLRLAGVGILQFASVLGLAGIALRALPAGRTVTTIYTMPLWAALFDRLLLKHRLAPVQMLGIVVSLSGLLFFLNPTVLDWSAPGVVAGTGLVLTAAMLWGLGAVLYKSQQWQASLLSQTLWQLIASGAVLLVLATIIEEPLSSRFTPTLLLILIWNWVVPTALAVWAWGKVLNRMTASVAGQLLMCTPFVGIAASTVIFNEDLPPAFAASTLLIVLGGLMVLVRRTRAIRSSLS